MVDDGRTDDGRTPDHGHPISSPYEPNGSGELINVIYHKPLVILLHQYAAGNFQTVLSCLKIIIILNCCMGKQTICIGENKGADHFAVTAELISAFVFATQLVQSLCFLIQNFQPLTIFCDCTAQLMSDLVRTQIVGFLTHRLICYSYHI